MVTTDSDHELEVYLNLASRMKLTGINQLWVADITYIRLCREFVFLAVILDAIFAESGGLGTGPNAWQRGCRRRRWRRRSRNESRRQASCIIRIAACNTLLTPTSASCAGTA